MSVLAVTACATGTPRLSGSSTNTPSPSAIVQSATPTDTPLSQPATYNVRLGPVAPEISRLAPDQRLNVLQRTETTEGVWAISRRSLAESPEYAEVVLLDRATGAVRHAVSLPGLPPQRLVVSPDAVYFARQGDGELPDSIVGRIDRQSLQTTAVIFPAPVDSGVTQEMLPKGWRLETPLPGAFLEALVLGGAELVGSGASGEVRLDAATLDVIRVDERR